MVEDVGLGRLAARQSHELLMGLHVAQADDALAVPQFALRNRCRMRLFFAYERPLDARSSTVG